MRLKDKVAIVVGAGQSPGELIGNGRATAVVFAREGAKVLLVDRSEDAVNETARMIEAEGGEASTFVCDVTQEQSCAELVKDCVGRYGRLDVLHNNVGGATALGDGPVEDLDVAIWNRVIELNLTTTALTCKYALPVMRSQKSGSIVNVSSTAVWAGTPLVGYMCSKAGVHALTRHVAAAGAADGVRCNSVVLGNVSARFKHNWSAPLAPGDTEPWDVGYAAAFLASDEARFITAVLIPIDGGASARLGSWNPSSTVAIKN